MMDEKRNEEISHEINKKSSGRYHFRLKFEKNFFSLKNANKQPILAKFSSFSFQQEQNPQ